MAFEPICNHPETVSKKDLKNIIKNEANNKDNQLIVYSVNPPTPIDWSTPGSAFKSIFRNSFIKEGYTIEETDFEGDVVRYKKKIKTHFIGHMFIELKCAGYPTILTGMSSPGYEEIKGLMLKGKSFTQIISTTKGHFNTATELQKEIDIRKSKVGNLSSMGVKLSHNSCEELLKYLTEYKACGVNNRYGGLDASPHKAEGAGCSAFAISFLQRLNIVPMLDSISSETFGSEFSRKIIVPHFMLKRNKKDPKVGAWGLLRGKKVSWAKDTKEGRNVVFFDPELFSKWVKDFNPENNNTGMVYLGRDGNPLVNSIWFEEKQNNIPPSEFDINYLLSI